MITLGVVDIVLLVVLIIAAVISTQRRSYGLVFFFGALFLLILVERLAPGFLATIGNAIHGIDALNDKMPHLSINPVITFK